MFTSEMDSFFNSNNKKENQNQENKNDFSLSKSEDSESSSCMQSSQLVIKIEHFENLTEEKKPNVTIAHSESHPIQFNNHLFNLEKSSENSIKSISKMNNVPKDSEIENTADFINIKSNKNPKLSYYNSNLKEIKKILLSSDDIRNIFTKNSIKIYYEEKEKEKKRLIES